MRPLLLSSPLLFGSLLFGPLLVGCEGPSMPGPLPDVLTVAVEMAWGGHASVAVDLMRPEQSPLVRVHSGLYALGPGWARRFELGPEGALEVTDLAPAEEGSAPWTTALSPEDRIVAVREGGAWVEGDTLRWVGAGPTPPTPGGPVSRKGPGRGFSLTLVDERLELSLPRVDPDDAGVPLISPVSRVLGNWWSPRSALPEWEQAIIERDFKQVAALPVTQGVVEVDGRLGEWRDLRAQAVDSSWQVLSGLEGWDGPRDGSFGASVQVSGSTIYLAVRVRDDAIVEGDHISVHLPGERIRVPIVPTDAPIEGPRWRAALSDALSHGVALELEIEDRGILPGRDRTLPLVVHLDDVDPGQVSTCLGTAAWPELIDAAYLDEEI